MSASGTHPRMLASRPSDLTKFLMKKWMVSWKKN